MKKIKALIRNYFGFSSRETNGFMVLSFLMICILFSPLLLNHFYHPLAGVSSNDKRLLDSLESVLKGSLAVAEIIPEIESVKFKFNPNYTSPDEFLRLGMKEKMARTIINYRSKGGKFRIKSDLKKMYGMPEALFLGLYDYIDLPDSLVRENYKQKKEEIYNKPKTGFKENKTFSRININAADSTELLVIKGIGLKLAARIVNYRKKLGGFTDNNQLYEVYGLDSAVVNELNKNTIIEEDYQPEKININKADLNELIAHPYLNYKLAKLIIAYRQQHGNYAAVKDLGRIKEFPPVLIEKMLPYLTQ